MKALATSEECGGKKVFRGKHEENFGMTTSPHVGIIIFAFNSLANRKRKSAGKMPQLGASGQI
jgi:hypothetical protein